MKNTLPSSPHAAFIFFGLFAIISSLSSCHEARLNPKSQRETPQALQHPSSSWRTLSKRGQENLVDNLFQEATEKHADLKSLEEKIDALKNAEMDSTAAFHAFEQDNNRYFDAANGYIDQIKDSALKQKIRVLIKAHLAKYNLSTAEHKRLMNDIAENNIQLEDLDVALKITTTLPMMNRYEEENLPSMKPLFAHRKNQEKMIHQVDSLAKIN